MLSNIVFGLCVGGLLNNTLVDWMRAVRISSWHQRFDESHFCMPSSSFAQTDLLGGHFV